MANYYKEDLFSVFIGCGFYYVTTKISKSAYEEAIRDGSQEYEGYRLKEGDVLFIKHISNDVETYERIDVKSVEAEKWA